ncbi:MAG TPA: hypothetical protein VKT73_06335 [Xanthobacteraceae bacterium]|nr:hypothetical protein [Xanthobacteraceae bacterium]
MSKHDHRKIAAECAIAAAATTSQGDREQLLRIQKKHLALAELEEAGKQTPKSDSTGRARLASRRRVTPSSV